MRIVEITWEDSVAWPGWQHQSDAEKWIDHPGHMQRSAGYLFSEDKRSVTLVQSEQVDGPRIGELLQIPKAAILRARYADTARAVRWRRK